jgi:hypothetical protein
VETQTAAAARTLLLVRSFGAMSADSEQAKAEFQGAQEAWWAAVQGHKLAPPDAGFSARLAALAGAARLTARACASADEAGFEWPARTARNPQPPYELRPGTGRRGPEDLWARFDRAIEELNRVAAGRSMRAMARAYEDLAELADELASAIAELDRTSGLLPRTRPARARQRRSA